MSSNSKKTNERKSPRQLARANTPVPSGNAQINLTLDELNVLAGLCSHFIEDVPISFDSTKCPLFPESAVQRVLIREYGNDWSKVDDGQFVDNCIFLSAEEVLDTVLFAPVSVKIQEAFDEWFTHYYLPRLRDIPRIYTAMPESMRQMIRELLHVSGGKCDSQQRCAVIETIKAKLLGGSNAIDIVSGRVTTIDSIFADLISQGDYSD